MKWSALFPGTIHLPDIKARELLRYLGPGILVTVGFIDPGNWAANIAAGSDYGYSLLWMVTLSTIMLIILQHNAAHLGIATGYCLSEAATPYQLSAPLWQQLQPKSLVWLLPCGFCSLSHLLPEPCLRQVWRDFSSGQILMASLKNGLSVLCRLSVFPFCCSSISHPSTGIKRCAHGLRRKFRPDRCRS